MKLYYKGNSNGKLFYSLDGGTTFTPTTLQALQEGIPLNDDIDYSLVKVKVNSAILSSLDAIKQIELVNEISTGLDTNTLKDTLKVSMWAEKHEYDSTSDDDPGYYYEYRIRIGEYNHDNNVDGFSILFKNKNTNEYKDCLYSNEDNYEDWEYVLIHRHRAYYAYSSNNDTITEVLNLGPIEPFFEYEPILNGTYGDLNGNGEYGDANDIQIASDRVLAATDKNKDNLITYKLGTVLNDNTLLKDVEFEEVTAPIGTRLTDVININNNFYYMSYTSESGEYITKPFRDTDGERPVSYFSPNNSSFYWPENLFIADGSFIVIQPKS